VSKTLKICLGAVAYLKKLLEQESSGDKRDFTNSFRSTKKF
jgi:hypothetical protein